MLRNKKTPISIGEAPSTGAIPPIDWVAPAHMETATFALG